MTKQAQLKGRAARLAALMPAGTSSAARAPFVLLVVALLGGGLITLLMLNSALNEGSFRLADLRRDTTELTDERQALQRDIDGYSAPDALQKRARELGMTAGGPPVFLDPDGTVRGSAAPASGAPAPPAPEPESPEPADPEPSAPGPSASPAASPSASPAASASLAAASSAPSSPSSTGAPTPTPTPEATE